MTGRMVPNATLVDRLDLSREFAIFRMRPDRVPRPEEPWFEPGQHVHLALAGDAKEGPEWVERPFSAASEPEERRWIEFYIHGVSASGATDLFIERLWTKRPGDRLRVGSRFSGRFTLRNTVGSNDTRLKVLVAAGTGIGPFVSMVRRAARRGHEGELDRLVVLHGASRPDGLAYAEELQSILNRGGERYFPTLSRSPTPAGWRGSEGRVETFFDGPRLAELERTLGLGEGGLVPRNAIVYVCGYRETVLGIVLRLLHRGFVPDDRELRRLIGIPKGAVPSMFFERSETEPIVSVTDAAMIERLRSEVG